MKNNLSIAAALLFLSACASTPPEATAPANMTAAKQQIVAPQNDALAEEPAVVRNVATSESGKVTMVKTTDDKDDEIVCRREHVTGSHFKRKVCRRASDLAARAEEDKAALRQMRAVRSGSQNATNGIRGFGN